MSEKLDLILEAERRGLPIPADKEALLAEARKRGLVGPTSAPISRARTFKDESLNAAYMGLGDRWNALTDAVVGRAPGDAAFDYGNYEGTTFGERYDRSLAAYQDFRDRSREENPVTAMAGATVGGLAPGATGANVAMRAGMQTAKTLAGRTGQAAAAGGATGGAVAFNEARPGERARDAQSGVVVGAGAGGLMAPVAEGIARIAGAVVRNVTDRSAAREAAAVGVSEDAARAARYALQAEFPGEAISQIRRAGPDAMVADSGRVASGMLDATLQLPGPAQSKAHRAVEVRAEKAGANLNRAMDDAMGKPRGFREIGREIASESAPARQAAYDAAYRSPIDYSSAAGRKLEATFKLVPPRIMRKALQQAEDAMIADGYDGRQIMAQIADDGRVTFVEMPNVIQADYLKRALDDLTEVDDFGRVTAQGRIPAKLARQVSRVLKDASPEYAEAVRLGGEKIGADRAALLGRNIFARQVTSEDVADAVRSMTPEQRTRLKEGMRSGIDDMLANVRIAMSDTNLDAREAMQVLRILTTRAGGEKISLALGSGPQAALLRRQVARALAAMELRAAVATNSRTAARQATIGAVKDVTAPGVVGQVMRGQPLEAGRRGVQIATGTTPADDAARDTAIFDDLARVLTEPRGVEAVRVYRALTDMAKREVITAAQADRVRKLLRRGGVAAAAPASMAAGTLVP